MATPIYLDPLCFSVIPSMFPSSSVNRLDVPPILPPYSACLRPPHWIRDCLTQVTEAWQTAVHPLGKWGLSCEEAPAPIRHQGDNRWRHLANASKSKARSSDQTSNCKLLLFLAGWGSTGWTLQKKYPKHSCCLLQVPLHATQQHWLVATETLRCLPLLFMCSPVDSKLFHWHGRHACCQLSFSEWAAQFCYNTGGNHATEEGTGPVNTKRETQILFIPGWKKWFRAVSLNDSLLSSPQHAVMWINSDYVWKPQKGKLSMSTGLKNGRFCSWCFMLLALASKFEHVQARWGRVVLY